jgi:hypothetical protein
LRTDEVDLGLGVGVIQRGVRTGRTSVRHAQQAAPSLVHKQGFRFFWGFHFFPFYCAKFFFNRDNDKSKKKNENSAYLVLEQSIDRSVSVWICSPDLNRKNCCRVYDLNFAFVKGTESRDEYLFEGL